VNEYVTLFTQLSYYAPYEVDIDEKKQECFLIGLNDGQGEQGPCSRESQKHDGAQA
jgi:hypothetical protein